MVRLSYLRLILPPCRLSEVSSLAILYNLLFQFLYLPLPSSIFSNVFTRPVTFIYKYFNI
ncbi:HLJ1_G0001570.mRNA.1.CDS.1 [Saccharomyces cerevisiae]|nr:HLJ1_G0001570.mRNA.1.CDS.1 [Saccharomyces cerevisiae]